MSSARSVSRATSEAQDVNSGRAPRESPPPSAVVPGGETPMLVAVRCRGLTPREKELGMLRFPNRQDTNYVSAMVDEGAGAVRLIDPDSGYASTLRQDRSYNFDLVFGESHNNREVYDRTVGPLIPWVLEGYNATCFAYGMTGAGKTYTMTGDATVSGLSNLAIGALFPSGDDQTGVVQTVHVSYFEIYNENVLDLLGTSSSSSSGASSGSAAVPERQRRFSLIGKTRGESPAGASQGGRCLQVIEDPHRGAVVKDLTEVLVTKPGDLQQLLARGSDRRTKAPTLSNVVSSRSHAILQMTVRRRQPFHNAEDTTAVHSTKDPRFPSTGTNAEGGGTVVVGRLSLIDLAGSERASTTYEKKKQERQQEGANINKSLLALGNCITILGNWMTAKNQTPVGHPPPAFPHVPYRVSKLTRLLKDSLGGNTRTVMFAMISPSCICYEETVSTLKYATRAKAIKRRLQRNTLESDSTNSGTYGTVITTLKADVDVLRSELDQAQQQELSRAAPMRAGSVNVDGVHTLRACSEAPSLAPTALSSCSPYREQDADEVASPFRDARNSCDDNNKRGNEQFIDPKHMERVRQLQSIKEQLARLSERETTSTNQRIQASPQPVATSYVDPSPEPPQAMSKPAVPRKPLSSWRSNIMHVDKSLLRCPAPGDVVPSYHNVAYVDGAEGQPTRTVDGGTIVGSGVGDDPSVLPARVTSVGRAFLKRAASESSGRSSQVDEQLSTMEVSLRHLQVRRARLAEVGLKFDLAPPPAPVAAAMARMRVPEGLFPSKDT